MMSIDHSRSAQDSTSGHQDQIKIGANQDVRQVGLP